MKTLLLFCGGESHKLYGNKPKPLFPAFDGVPIITKFLSALNTNHYEDVVLLVEERHGEEFRDLCRSLEVTVFECGDGSTTYEKAQLYVNCESKPNTLLYITYPDIFAEEDFYRECGENSVTIVPVRSRFPTVIREPFSAKIKGVSYTQPKLPANPSFIFGGLLVISRDSLRASMSAYTGEKNFELQFLNYLSTKGILDAVIYCGPWNTADGVRDIRIIEAK